MSHMDIATLVICTLAVARLTRLITRDRITRAPREWLLRRLDAESLTAWLIVCDWCASFYVGLGAGAVGTLVGWWTWAWIVPLGLAFSYVAGWLASMEDE